MVNERDGLGDETPPDYLTSVRDGGFHGLALQLLGPDGGRPGAAGSGHGREGDHAGYALGGHTASLGLCWLPADTLPGFPEGMAIGQHGSLNRKEVNYPGESRISDFVDLDRETVSG